MWYADIGHLSVFFVAARSVLTRICAVFSCLILGWWEKSEQRRTMGGEIRAVSKKVMKRRNGWKNRAVSKNVTERRVCGENREKEKDE